ncbi:MULTISPECIES: hypothetical protein [unclassified Moraxella]|uniref:hypothetical protein n=1 Tax=unclassified Moraxella TaxID=2685852 RepID=UPI003AF7EFB6
MSTNSTSVANPDMPLPTEGATANPHTVTVTVTRTTPTLDIPQQRLRLFRQQEQRVTQCHQNGTAFYISQKSAQFKELHKLQTAHYLNSRDTVELGQLMKMVDTLHVVDDLVLGLVSQMPAQRPLGWQMTAQNANLLNLPTVGIDPYSPDYRRVEQSLASTVLQFFGVACYQPNAGYFIGHILGYLFCCYYFAHLGVGYSVTPLKETVVANYPYQWVNVPESVRLLQELDESLKAQVYQLAIYVAQISEYAIDKRIERMLIAEVNSFNKQDLREELSAQLQYGEIEHLALFQPVKPLK